MRYLLIIDTHKDLNLSVGGKKLTPTYWINDWGLAKLYAASVDLALDLFDGFKNDILFRKSGRGTIDPSG
jgi:hypothetical protein